ncbi:MAG: CDP-diacylglycerol--serine O-phosphatidyltransferase [Bacteroidales bacterium]|nr:CDP-diacylglycerol--serine O-phosphatidyltransferase [Bacteroidales bacterium]
MKHIPNFITCLNLAAGFTAVIFASRGFFTTASWLIVAAMVFDFLDGFSARLLNAYSETGKELDSLADVVSFGVAPALIIHKMIEAGVSETQGVSPFMTDILPFVPVLMPMLAGLRLAIFNVDTTQATVFKGLPTPANAIAVISVVLAAAYSQSPFIRSFTGSPGALAVYTIILSVLMVTRIPLLSNKFKGFRFRGNEWRFIMAAVTVAMLLIFGIASAPLIIPVYILISVAAQFASFSGG